ncbi:MAG: hypothetical protein E7599_05665 [Ruminococcaceae bacterium]|nr:hypothetical protein [Oscillospiraceae bacterium]
MKLKRICNIILFPPIVLTLLLVPLSCIGLLYAFLRAGSQSVAAIAAYVLSAYTLTVVCLQMPRLLRLIKRKKEDSALLIRWRRDVRYRISLSLYASLAGNAVYAALHGALGLYHGSFWYGTLAIYYLLLALMRFFLLRHTRRSAPGENLHAELVRYRICGLMLLILNLTLSLMVFFMTYWERTFHHHMITAITLAMCTFWLFTLSIINIVRYRKYRSPVYSAAKAIGLASACVSMLTLTSTMLTTFGDKTMDVQTRNLMLKLVGAGVALCITSIALYMLIFGTKKYLKLERDQNNGK